MSVFSVCSHFVENSGRDNDFLLNVLYRFVQENPLRVTVDAPEARVIELYENVSKRSRSQDLRRWLRFLGRNPAKNIEYVDACVRNLNERNVFVEIASRTISQKCVVSWSLQDYALIEAEAVGVEIIDRHEALSRVHKHDIGPRIAEIKTTKEGLVVKNYFSGIQGSTIILESLVQGSFNRVKQQNNEEAAEALLKLAEYINKSKNPAAGALLNSFNEELIKPEPNKSLLKGLWSGLTSTLPDILKLGEAVTKITSLFL